MCVGVPHDILRCRDGHRGYSPFDLLVLERCEAFDARKEGLTELDIQEFANAPRGSSVLTHAHWERRRACNYP